jgi:hypothetical protein
VRRSSLALLLVTILAALAVSTAWALRVPIFQEPDELAHADYAFALFDVGHPFVAIDPDLSTSASRQATYLSAAVGYRAMRYNPYARVAAGYGGSTYFRFLDDRAPARTGSAPPARAAFPYVAGLYPMGYYALEAGVMLVAAAATGGSLTSAFFTGRLVGVALLGITLGFGFLIFRRSGLPERESFLATAAVGFFPLVAWVAGYVQPDNLVAALYSAGLAVAIGPRSHAGVGRKRDVSCVAIVGAIVTLTVLTKAHYAFALWLATVPLLVARVPATRRRLGAALFVIFGVVLPLVAYRLSVTTLNPVRRLISPGAWVASAGAGSLAALPSSMAAAGLHAFDDAFFGGIAGLGFWLHFGMRSGSFVPDDAVGPVRDLIVALTVLALALFAALELRLIPKLIAIARRRSPGLALRLATNCAPLNAYAIVTVMLIAIGAITRGGLVLQGRYWLPVVTSLGVVLFVALPRIARAGPRRRIRFGITCAAAAYSIVASVVALVAMNANFYEPPARAPTHDSVADVDRMRVASRTIARADTLDVRRGETLVASGYAVDMRTGLPARNVVVSIDGRDAGSAVVGLRVPKLAETFNDDALLRSGFDARIPTARLRPGTHLVRFFVASDSGSERLAFRREIHLRVI